MPSCALTLCLACLPTPVPLACLSRAPTPVLVCARVRAFLASLLGYCSKIGNDCIGTRRSGYRGHCFVARPTPSPVPKRQPGVTSDLSNLKRGKPNLREAQMLPQHQMSFSHRFGRGDPTYVPHHQIPMPKNFQKISLWYPYLLAVPRLRSISPTLRNTRYLYLHLR
jgi:hypothetical protein